MYIVFDDVLATDATLHSERVASWLQKQYPDFPVTLTHEPGGTDTLGYAERGKRRKDSHDPLCQAYLHAAYHAQTIRNVVQPYSRRRGIVVSSRGFVTSLVHWGIARGLGLETIWNINKPAVGNNYPDILVFLHLSEKTAYERACIQAGTKLSHTDADLLAKVVHGYDIVACLPLLQKRWITIDAEGDPDCVFENILRALQPKLAEHL